MLLIRALTPADMQAAAPGKPQAALQPSEEYIEAALDTMSALLSPIAKCVVNKGLAIVAPPTSAVLI
jgi:hypothetical protein